MADIPLRKPNRPNFSSGPCIKNKFWSFERVIDRAIIGRSHRCDNAQEQIRTLIKKIRTILKIPNDYKIGIVPASNTGAYELALWTFVGLKPVDILAWESFGFGWAHDIIKELKVCDVNYLKAEYGYISDFKKIRKKSDICFTLNGTSSGVRLPNTEWIPDDLEGITICDATSALFSQNIDWSKLDVTTFSWQKAIGGEAAHGVIIISPKGIERLKNYNPTWPMPKIFRIKKNNVINYGFFEGLTINTPSMLCIADAIECLEWLESIGGLDKSIQRTEQNFTTLQNWIDQQDWVENLCDDKKYRSITSVCLKIVDPSFLKMKKTKKEDFINKISELLEMEKVAYDIKGHRDAPLSLRIWCGPTIENEDIVSLLPWLTWSFSKIKNNEG